MRLRNSPDGYGAIAQFLHWITVLLVVMAWTLGIVGDELPKGAARAAGLFVHMSAGLAILIVLTGRLLWRLADPPPPECTAFGAWLDRVGRLAHCGLYALLVAAPLAGIVVQFARCPPLTSFGI